MSEGFEAWCIVLDRDSGEKEIIAEGYSEDEARDKAYRLNKLEREECRYYAQKE